MIPFKIKLLYKLGKSSLIREYFLRAERSKQNLFKKDVKNKIIPEKEYNKATVTAE